MDALLEKDAVVRLEDLPGTFRIVALQGRGGSCAVYRTEYTDAIGNRMEYLLKEYNPAHLPMERDRDGRLRTGREQSFQEGLLRFRAGYDCQDAIRRISGLKNVTAPPSGIYAGNGTLYSLTPLFDGQSYDQVQDESLLETLQTLRALTAVLEKYHRAGYLHLDVKPANLLVIPETRELVILFDFDSVVRAELPANGIPVSYTQSWAAPELKTPGMQRAICQATDLFAVGEILFTRVMGQHSQELDRRSFSTYGFPKDAPLLRHADGILLQALTDFFHHTLCTSVRTRWQSAGEVLEALDRLIGLARRRFWLCSTCPAPKDFFVGRDRELEQIHQQLCQNRILFLWGMGGVGKSELARAYAKRWAADYDVALFVFYAGSWMMTVTDDTGIRIANCSQVEQESPEDYFQRKVARLQELCTRRTLLIIDNLNQSEFDGEEARRWRQVLSLDCTLLVTSRSGSWEQPRLHLETFSDRAAARRIFDYWYTEAEKGDDEAIGALLKLLDGHPMAVEIIAKQLSAGGDTPQEMLDKLRTHGIAHSGRENIRSEKDHRIRQGSAFDHIRMLFDVASLGKEWQAVLRNMALIQPEGVDRRLFKSWCGLETLDPVNSLCAFGWLERQGKAVSIHPLVSDVVLSEDYDQAVHNHFLSGLGHYIYDGLAQQSFSDRATRQRLGVWAADALQRHRIETEASAQYYNWLSLSLSDSASYNLAERYGRYCLDLCRQVYGDVHRSTVNAYSNLGAIYFYKNDYSRCEAYLEQGRVLQDQLGECDPELLVKRHLNQGVICLERCHYPDAEVHLQEALKLQEKYATDHSDIAFLIYFWLGRLKRNQGRTSDALACYQKALETQREAIHNKRVSTLYNELGILYDAAGEGTVAEKYYRKAIEIETELYGPEHPNVAVQYLNLSAILDRQGDTETALAYCQKALAVHLAHFGEAHAKTAAAYLRIATIHLRKMDFERAQADYSRALDIYLKLFGENHSRVSECCSGLCTVYRMQDNYEQAIAYGTRALQITQALHTPDWTHPDIAVGYSILGSVEAHFRHYELSAAYYSQAVTIYQERFGPNYRRTARAEFRLGLAYYRCKRYKEALPHVQASSAYYEAYPNADPRYRKNAKSLLVKLSNGL